MFAKSRDWQPKACRLNQAHKEPRKVQFNTEEPMAWVCIVPPIPSTVLPLHCEPAALLCLHLSPELLGISSEGKYRQLATPGCGNIQPLLEAGLQTVAYTAKSCHPLLRDFGTFHFLCWEQQAGNNVFILSQPTQNKELKSWTKNPTQKGQRTVFLCSQLRQLNILIWSSGKRTKDSMTNPIHHIFYFCKMFCILYIVKP